LADPVIEAHALGKPPSPWPAWDPFLFCVHHDDHYPASNGAFGPNASMAGRQMGSDFSGRDGFSMYHGRSVPGFPPHPHRGFETLTLARRGLIDHSDSLGAIARFGQGDAQWMTAGRGIVHSEMFPLLDPDAPNPLELFQLWINLPAEDKMVDPHFSMLWDREIPRWRREGVEVAVVAGELDGLRAPPPPPRSWASRPDTDVAVFTIRLGAGARWTLPRARRDDANRALYLFLGAGIRIDGRELRQHAVLRLDPGAEVPLEALDGPVELLLLQGRPIGEPVVQHGPFVMNKQEEIRQTILDYQRTRFGGWPWDSEEPVHGADPARFARRVGGEVEREDQA
jgi:redox-sensitive bicupin YhaK (pirin superfamily)